MKNEGIKQVGNKKVLEMRPTLNPETLHVHLQKTSMCMFIMEGKICRHGSNCRFAHTTDELLPKQCIFGSSCRLVKKVKPDTFVNLPHPKTGKTCSFHHPEESKESYAKRLGIPLGR